MKKLLSIILCITLVISCNALIQRSNSSRANDKLCTFYSIRDFKDSSRGGVANAITATGVVTSNTQTKFGVPSVFYDATADRFRLASNASFLFGTSDWTIDWWVYSTDATADQNLMRSAEIFVSYRGSSDDKVSFYTDNFGIGFISSGVMPNNEWVHMAVGRYKNKLFFYIKGASQGTADATASNISTSSVFGIGCRHDLDAETFKGYITQPRFSKGIARWIAPFEGDLPNTLY